MADIRARHVLPRHTPALGLGAPVLDDGRPGPPGTLHVLGPLGGVAAPPEHGDTVDFGRSPDVAVRLGVADPAISRRHGTLRHDGRDWWLRNEGRLPIRVAGAGEPLLQRQELRLGAGFLPLFVDSDRRTHVVELLVSPAPSPGAPDEARLETRPRPVWTVTDAERLVLAALFAPYLRRDDDPRPALTGEVADLVSALTGEPWSAKRIGRTVDGVRVRLAGRGVARMLVDQAAPDTLRHHLYRALAVDTATLTPRDLDLLDPDGGAP